MNPIQNTPEAIHTDAAEIRLYILRAGFYDRGFHNLSSQHLVKLWRMFSEIQSATWMKPDVQEAERFAAWLISGNDEDCHT